MITFSNTRALLLSHIRLEHKMGDERHNCFWSRKFRFSVYPILSLQLFCQFEVLLSCQIRLSMSEQRIYMICIKNLGQFESAVLVFFCNHSASFSAPNLGVVKIGPFAITRYVACDCCFLGKMMAG